MITSLDETADALGAGTLLSLKPSGELLFKLDSYAGNPIVTPRDIGLTWYEDGEEETGAVFNPGAVRMGGKVVLTPRWHRHYERHTIVDSSTGIKRTYFEKYVPQVRALFSKDGVDFEPGEGTIVGDGTDHEDFVHGIEDVRIIKHGSRYLLVGTGKVEPASGRERPPSIPPNGGDRIAIYVTENFKEIEYCGTVKSFNARNAVPMLEPINGKYHILLRFHPDIYPGIHLDVLEGGVEQLLRPDDYGEEWARIYERREESVLLKAGLYPHEKEKIGAGTPLIRTERGWLLIYHAVGDISSEVCEAYGLAEPIERGYSICAALLAHDDPRRVLSRTGQPIGVPSAPCELYGDSQYAVDVPAVLFPTGAFVRNGKLLVYAGAGDKYVVLLGCRIEELADYLWQHCRVAT
jgi:predicted GH43/DUF377 family glycosyl hydrolase